MINYTLLFGGLAAFSGITALIMGNTHPDFHWLTGMALTCVIAAYSHYVQGQEQQP